MNDKVKRIFMNLNYTITANFLILGISIVLNLVVPKYLGVIDYGYWQLYVFFTSYIGFFHLGWIDGIHLKIGGIAYDDLDKSSLGTQLRYLLLLEIFFALLVSIYAVFFVSDHSRQFIWLAVAVMLIVFNIKSFVLFILQSTDRIKEYAKISRNDRYLYLLSTMIYLFSGGRNPLVLISLDVMAQSLVTIWGLVITRDLVLSKNYPFFQIMREVKENILIGSNLMIGYIASILIIGVPRFIVERRWDIETFGKLSFALSISSMFMTFTNAISIVLYPVLRRVNQDTLPNLYVQIRHVFVPFTLALLLLFYPIRIVLEWWLPEYQASLFFMGILFPMVVYEGRVSLLVNTYLKTIRAEKIFLMANVSTLVISTILSIISIFIFNDIHLTVLMIILSLAFRCMLAEGLLMKILKINLIKEILLETSMILIFVFSNLFFDNFRSCMIYLLVFILYTVLFIPKIKEGLQFFIVVARAKS